MSQSKIKLGINGFGRIGRSMTRIALANSDLFEISAINDLDSDIDNHSYLLKYDTTYGQFAGSIKTSSTKLICNDHIIQFYSDEDISKIPWDSHDVDIVIDSSGVFHNVLAARKLLNNQRVKKVFVTHNPREGVDFTLLTGVNESLYNKNTHNIISTSICDVVAIAPFFKVINDCIGIESAHLTTLHPWLQYQNLLDGTIKSVSSPGHYWKDYTLGRSSIGTLLPKQTTVVNALEKVIPNVTAKTHAMSFRIPTSIVSAAEGSFVLNKQASIKQIVDYLYDHSQKYRFSILLSEGPLVSCDFKQSEFACAVDLRWLHITNNNLLRFMLWYDNEWGYSSRVLDAASFVFQSLK